VIPAPLHELTLLALKELPARDVATAERFAEARYRETSRATVPWLDLPAVVRIEATFRGVVRVARCVVHRLGAIGRLASCKSSARRGDDGLATASPPPSHPV
jgi:hypothetical protein